MCYTVSSNENEVFMRKPISINIISRQTRSEGDFFADGDNKNEEQKIEISTEGVLVHEDGRFSVRYDETELTGMEGSVTVVEFSDDDPSTVTMTRSGSASASMIFKENSRYMSTYETGIFPIEMCVATKSVCNEITENGGTVTIDYTIEIHGVCMERTYLMLTASPINE